MFCSNGWRGLLDLKKMDSISGENCNQTSKRVSRWRSTNWKFVLLSFLIAKIFFQFVFSSYVTAMKVNLLFWLIENGRYWGKTGASRGSKQTVWGLHFPIWPKTPWASFKQRWGLVHNAFPVTANRVIIMLIVLVNDNNNHFLQIVMRHSNSYQHCKSSKVFNILICTKNSLKGPLK